MTEQDLAASSNEPKKLLLIGPLPTDTDVIGGTKVSFANLRDYLCESAYWQVDVFDVSRARSGGALSRVAAAIGRAGRLVLKLAFTGWRYDLVLLNASPGAVNSVGPLFYLLCLLHRRAFVVRVFGGDYDDHYQRLSGFRRWLVTRTVVRGSSLFLLQTKKLVDSFGALANVRWLPTSRRKPENAKTREHGQRLLFVGQLRAEKGVIELLDAVSSLPAAVSLTVIGPSMPGLNIDWDNWPRISYEGQLMHEQVLQAVQSHDVFVFPSYYPGEGYPGSVIEALLAGMPIVTTHWKALPDLVEHERNGLLVAPRSVEAVRAALARLYDEPELVGRLSAGALEMASQFDSERVNDALNKALLQIVDKRAA